MVPPERGARVAELTGGRLVVLEGSGHLALVRDPVGVNLLLRDVACGPRMPARWARPASQPRRALVVSSPIGLGHAWRDVRIADELRRRVPGLVVEWLAQEPVTSLLAARGETIHPASAELASEAGHIDAEAGEHRLHAFEAIRRMDEILCANFMLFSDVVRDTRYDLWIGDEAWELDVFLHENPELKTAPFAWLTDFVGWLPMPAGGEREAALCADENAAMIDRVERAPRVRDVALYLGEPGDVVDASFGPGLPSIRAWTAAPSPAGRLRDRAARRATAAPCAPPRAGRTTRSCASSPSAGRGPARRCCAVRRPRCRRCGRRIPRLRMVALAGPRLDPGLLPDADGLEVRGYVHEAHRLAAACDVALVQGGLATTMELVAAGRPFVSVPAGGPLRAAGPRAPPPRPPRRAGVAAVGRGDARGARGRRRRGAGRQGRATGRCPTTARHGPRTRSRGWWSPPPGGRTAAMSPQPKKAAGDAPAGMEELAEQVRQLNEQIIEASKRSGETYLQSYQQLLKTVADVQEEAGKSSPWDWVTTMATAQANFTRDIAEAYAAAGRRLQGGE